MLQFILYALWLTTSGTLFAAASVDTVATRRRSLANIIHTHKQSKNKTSLAQISIGNSLTLFRQCSLSTCALLENTQKLIRERPRQTLTPALLDQAIQYSTKRTLPKHVLQNFLMRSLLCISERINFRTCLKTIQVKPVASTFTAPNATYAARLNALNLSALTSDLHTGAMAQLLYALHTPERSTEFIYSFLSDAFGYTREHTPDDFHTEIAHQFAFIKDLLALLASQDGKKISRKAYFITHINQFHNGQGRFFFDENIGKLALLLDYHPEKAHGIDVVDVVHWRYNLFDDITV